MVIVDDHLGLLAITGRLPDLDRAGPIVLDPRASADQSIRVAVEHQTNLLLAEMVGAAVHHGAAIG